MMHHLFFLFSLTMSQISADNAETWSQLLKRIEDLREILDEALKRIGKSGGNKESLADLQLDIQTLVRSVRTKPTVFSLTDIDAEILRGLESHTTTRTTVELCNSCLQRKSRMTWAGCRTGYVMPLSNLRYDCVKLLV